MKMNYECLPCLVNQVVKVADMTNADNREELFKKVFTYLSGLAFTETNPEIIGTAYAIIKEHIGSHDPYKDIKKYYNKMFLDLSETLEKEINSSEHVFEKAVKYAVIGNIIDFNPIHNSEISHIMKWFEDSDKYTFAINHTEQMVSDLKTAKVLLYLGDNCGEICLDKILLKKVKLLNPQLQIYFGVRGEAVINDSVEEDAYFVGIQEVAAVISNGDGSLGTVISRTSEEFRRIFHRADIIIAKGQANYESLSEERNKNIYFLLMTKCKVIADDIGTDIKKIICLHNRN